MDFNLNKNTINSHLFSEKLHTETRLIHDWFKKKNFSWDEFEVGSELEFFILDSSYQPHFENLKFIEQNKIPNLIPEIGKFQLEINSEHFFLAKDGLKLLHENISHTWQRCCQAAQKSNCHLALIGSLPNTKEEHAENHYITDTVAAKIFSQYMNHYKKQLGKNGTSSDKGFSSIALLGHICSFQLHLKVALEHSVKSYNAAQMITAPFLALCCNSPFFFQKHMSHESRIVIFEQLSRVSKSNRQSMKMATFGDSYLINSFGELFQKNIAFPYIIPVISSDEAEKLFHLRAQNNSIFRWNRPIVDFEQDNTPHLRIEHRAIPVGPTITDMIANAAFYYGLVGFLTLQDWSLTQWISFTDIQKNFYRVVKHGLNCKLTWFNQRTIDAPKLLSELTLLARKGLLMLGVHSNDVDYYLNIIQRRIITQQTGSAWQLSFIKKYGPDFRNLLEAYLENQYSEIPISDWRV